jgi:uracil-DNA glycosylase
MDKKVVPQYLTLPWADLLVVNGMHSILDLIQDIESRLSVISQTTQVFPFAKDRYKAFELQPESVRAVCVGQDPYFNEVNIPGQEEVVPEAMGLSFSVPRIAKIPPSLRNIFKELHEDIGCPIPSHGDLSAWAAEGVLLINRSLSVERGRPNSHKDLGWHQVTESLISALSREHYGIVFILWGGKARSLVPHIAKNGHTIIESSHPSSMGGSCHKGFFGSRPFSRANRALIELGKKPINWEIS